MKNSKKRKIFYETTFVIGLILLFAQIPIIYKTLIDFITPVLIVLTVGVLTSFIDYKNYSDLYRYEGRNRYLYPFMHFLAGYGGIVLFLFFALNYFLSSDVKTITEYNILESGSYNIKNSSEKKTYFIINYNGKNKELVFSASDFKELDEYKKIELTTKKGFFNYDILVSKKIKQTNPNN
ncbi:hypothetical protein [Algibacter sp. 2305UL17-15]|uniref:hypothetical protein n=1 Tax=Algibacter sp. 2305UL17-15 TaxID=3231268 RepID=UPI003457B427